METAAPYLLVSACLAGECCRYDGGNNLVEGISALVSCGKALAVCPELAGGLPCPRTPCERQEIDIRGKDGNNYTQPFLAGVESCLALLEQYPIKGAILKEGSPSCGVYEIYDGTFTGVRISGQGLLATALQAKKISVWSEQDFLNYIIPSEAL